MGSSVVFGIAYFVSDVSVDGNGHQDDLGVETCPQDAAEL